MLVLSLSAAEDSIWAAGPDGLYCFDGQEWLATAQPHQQLSCCAVIGDQILVGGAPYGVAFRALDGETWKSAWMDGLQSPALCLAADPQVVQSGVVLAGTQSDGILRSTDRGRFWTGCNFGLQDFGVLALHWAPVAPEKDWPRWQVVFAATEDGLYRSINGGLAWQSCDGPQGVFLSVAAAPDFQSSGVVLAGSEESGLWRSQDGGRHFERLPGERQQVNALLAMPDGWLMSDEQGLWNSQDGLEWKMLPGSRPALALLAGSSGVWAGGEDGVEMVALNPTA
jgi:ligand-binding sensor domain-containing protein